MDFSDSQKCLVNNPKIQLYLLSTILKSPKHLNTPKHHNYERNLKAQVSSIVQDVESCFQKWSDYQFLSPLPLRLNVRMSHYLVSFYLMLQQSSLILALSLIVILVTQRPYEFFEITTYQYAKGYSCINSEKPNASNVPQMCQSGQMCQKSDKGDLPTSIGTLL